MRLLAQATQLPFGPSRRLLGLFGMAFVGAMLAALITVVAAMEDCASAKESMVLAGVTSRNIDVTGMKTDVINKEEGCL